MCPPGLRERQRGPRPGPCLTPSGHLSRGGARGRGKKVGGKRREGVEGIRKRGAHARDQARRQLFRPVAPPHGARACPRARPGSRSRCPSRSPSPRAAPAASASDLGGRPSHPPGRRPPSAPERAPGREARISKVTRARVQKAGVAVAAAVAPQRAAPHLPLRGVKVWPRDPAGAGPESGALVGAGPCPACRDARGHFRRPLPPVTRAAPPTSRRTRSHRPVVMATP